MEHASAREQERIQTDRDINTGTSNARVFSDMLNQGMATAEAIAQSAAAMYINHRNTTAEFTSSVPESTIEDLASNLTEIEAFDDASFDDFAEG